MVANTKPVPLNLNDNTQLSYSNLIGVEYGDGSEFLKTAPQIQVWGGVGYTYYYYLTDAYDLVADDGSTFEGWADIGGNYVNTAIETGRGFWVKAVTGEFTINFAK